MPDPTNLGESSSGLPANIAAAVATIPLLGGIVFLILETKNQFVRFYAMQSVCFGLVWMVVSVLVGMLVRILWAVPIIGWLMLLVVKPVAWLLTLGFLAIWATTIFNAFFGSVWEIPVLGAYARQQLAKTPPSTGDGTVLPPDDERRM